MISSLPNLISSLAVPLIGYLFSNNTNLPGWLFSLAIILVSHTSYLIIPDHLAIRWLTVIPIFIFGFGHATFSTLRVPIVPQLITEKEFLPICFSIMSINSSLAIAVFTMIAGWLREWTESYTSVTLLMLGCNIIALFSCYKLAYAEKD